MRDIGVLNLARFGDLIQTTPVLTGLRKRHPGAKIHLIVKRRFRGVAEMLPGVDAIHEIDGDTLVEKLFDPETPFVGAFRAVRDAVDHLCRLEFDMLINFTHSRASAVLLSLMQADRRVGFTIDREGHRRVDDPWLAHVNTLVRARRLMRFNLTDIYLGGAGVLGCGEQLAVRILEGARDFAIQLLPGEAQRVAVQLGSTTNAASWTVDRFADSLSQLQKRLPEIRIVLVGVPSEADEASRLESACTQVRFENLVGQTSVDQLAAVLERCDILLTGDTGTMHLAAAVGTPTCGVFVGRGYPHETCVYAEGHWAVSARLPCFPCAHTVDCGYPACHDDVPASWLAELLARILTKDHPEQVPRLPGVELLRTRFDQHSLLEVVPVHRRPADSEDLLSLAFREIFVESFAGIPAQPESVWRRIEERFELPAEGWATVLPEGLEETMAQLEELSRSAETCALELDRVGRDAVALREAGERLDRADQSIYQIARSQPLLAPFGLSLEVGLESLPDGDLPALSAVSARHYAELGRRVRAFRRIIRGPAGGALPKGVES